MNFRNFVSKVLSLVGRSFKPEMKFSGFETGRVENSNLGALSDEDLKRVNSMLPWMAFIVDSQGRRFGNVAWNGKRVDPQVIPDPRIEIMNAKFGLTNRSVLEIGCFEGIHTLGLLKFTSAVKAVDARVENVVKTIVRCAMLGYSPKVSVCDIEATPADTTSLAAEFAHHVGVLYHLKNPVEHLLDLGKYISEGIMLDTHYAKDDETTAEYVINEVVYKYKPYAEHGRNEVFSGMYDHAKWLRLEDLISILKQAGFATVEIAELREERNGPRVLIFANR